MAERGEQRATFIVRLARSASGQITGVVERVRTGEKSRVIAVEAVAEILAEMLAREPGEDESLPGVATCRRAR